MQDFNYQFQDDSFTISLGLDSVRRQAFAQAQHGYRYTGSKPPAGWREEYYDMFLSHPDDRGLIADLISGLRSQGNELSEDAFLERVVAFVQGSIAYDWQTYHNIDQSTIRYPYETLFDKTGVCADKSILMARLFSELGYDCAFFIFERANHMALGLRVPPGNGDFRSDYAFVETTNYAPIGRIPSNYVGGIRLERNPKVFKVRGGGEKVFEKIVENKSRERDLEKKYGKEYFFLGPEQKRLKEEMAVLQAEMDALKKDLRGCRGTLPQAKFEECNRLQQEHNSRVEKFNALVERFNALNDPQTPA